MEIKELYKIIIDELGVSDDKKPKYDNWSYLAARGIFCRIAKEMGFKTLDISDQVCKETTCVNRYIRENIKKEWESGFISKYITSKYHELKQKIKEHEG